MSRVIETERLELRPWEPSDVADAFRIFRAPSVARWLTPDLAALHTPEAMGAALERWHDEAARDAGSEGHWAILPRGEMTVIGSATLQYAPPGGESLTVAWALAPHVWGHGYAAEAGDALVHWAIHEGGETEVYALVQPDNARAAATAERIGMQWVEELGHVAQGRYQVYRLRHGDLVYED
jgi:RimJ/RimL family protein N-acetyltransferase